MPPTGSLPPLAPPGRLRPDQLALLHGHAQLTTLRLSNCTAVGLPGLLALARSCTALESLSLSLSEHAVGAHRFAAKDYCAYWLLGAGNKAKGITAPHHDSRFDIDEDALDMGVRLFVNAAMEFTGIVGSGRGRSHCSRLPFHMHRGSG